ncbi:MAG: hypothetical protein IT373_05595 [Polyangiaceae bacterium]|nr:hypothetical protein [Polyangiaceae bacterium]
MRILGFVGLFALAACAGKRGPDAAPKNERSFACENNAPTDREQALTAFRDGWLHHGLEELAEANRVCAEEASAAWADQIAVLAELGREAEVRSLASIIEASEAAPAEAKRAAAAARGSVATHAAEGAEELYERALAAGAAGKAVEARRLFDRALEAFARRGLAGTVRAPNGFPPGAGVARSGSNLLFVDTGRLVIVGPEGRATREVVLAGEDGKQLVPSALATDGARAVVGGADGSVVVVDPERAEEVRRFSARAPVAAVALRGERVAAGLADGRVVVWLPEARELGTHTGGAHALAFSASGLLASGGADAVVRVWDVELGKELAKLTTSGAVQALAASPSGAELAVSAAAAAGVTVEVVTLPDGAKRTRIGPPKGARAALAFAADGLALGVAAGESLAFYDARTGKAKATAASGHPGLVFTAAAFAGDGTLVGLLADGELVRLDKGGEAPGRSGRHAPRPRELATNAGDRIGFLAGAELYTVDLHPDGTRAVQIAPAPATAHHLSMAGRASAFALADGARAFTYVVDVFGDQRGVLRREHELEQASTVTATAMPAEGTAVYTGGADGWVRVFGAKSAAGRQLFDLGAPVVELAVAPENAGLVAAGANGRVIVWDVSDDKEIERAELGADPIRAVGADESFGKPLAGVLRESSLVLLPLGKPRAELEVAAGAFGLSLGNDVAVLLRPDTIEVVAASFAKPRAGQSQRVAGVRDAAPTGIIGFMTLSFDGTVRKHHSSGLAENWRRLVEHRRAGYLALGGGRWALAGDELDAARAALECWVGGRAYRFELCEGKALVHDYVSF